MRTPSLRPPVFACVSSCVDPMIHDKPQTHTEMALAFAAIPTLSPSHVGRRQRAARSRDVP